MAARLKSLEKEAGPTAPHCGIRRPARARRTLHATAAVPPASLFAPLLQQAARPGAFAADAVGGDAAAPLSDEERLMCARAVSRLAEMCGAPRQAA